MQDRSQGRALSSRRTFIASAMSVASAIGLMEAPVAARRGSPGLAAAWAAYDRATIGKDIAALAVLVTDDYMLVNSDGSLQDKQSYLADFAMPGFTLDPYDIEQRVQRTWGNTALTGGVFNLGWTQDGRRHARRLRFAHIWSRTGGRWRIAYTQLTRVPE